MLAGGSSSYPGLAALGLDGSPYSPGDGHHCLHWWGLLGTGSGQGLTSLHLTFTLNQRAQCIHRTTGEEIVSEVNWTT